MRAREGRLEIGAGFHAELGHEDRGGSLEARIGGLRGEGERLAPNVLHFLDAGVRIGDDFHLVTEGAVFSRHHGEGAETGAGHGQRVRTGIEAGNVQATGAHGLDLGGVRLDREELDVLARHFGHVIEKALPDFDIDSRIFDRRIGEDQRVRINPVRRNLPECRR